MVLVTTPAPEPVEVAADELAAAGKPRFSTLAEAEEIMRTTAGKWVPQGVCALVMAEYERRGVAESELIQYHNEGHALLVSVVAERDRLRAFLLEATGTLPAYGFANDERGDPWVRWLERVAAYLTQTHR